MYERANYLAVGIFIVVGAVALVAVGFWVGGFGQAVPMSRYTIIFERDVNGLSEGSPVRYMGVDVGTVTLIRLFHARNTAIAVEIEIAESTPVDSGTYATLGYQGITGVAFINLAAEPGEHEAIAMTAGHDYPVIPTRDVGIAALLNAGPDILAKVSSALDDLSRVLSEENVGAATRTLANVEQFTAALAEQRRAMAELPVRANEALVLLHSTLDQVADITDEAGPELLAASKNFRQSMQTLVDVSARVDYWLTENDAAVQDFLNQGMGETAALVSDAREAMREMEKLVAELRDNPSRFIYKPKQEPVVVAK